MEKQDIQLLDKVKHKDIKINTQAVDVLQNQVNVAFVVVNELSAITHEYPIFITKNPNTGQFQLVALLGFKSGENLFIQDGKWQATYLPLDILRRPFQAMLEKEGDTSSGRIAIDMSSEQVQTNKGEPLFNDDGSATEFLQRVQTSFSQLMGGTERTTQILQTAGELGLIEGINLDIELPNGEKRGLNGLYAFNQEAVTQLTGANLETCHQQGVLQVCHLVLSSGLHLNKLIKWAS